MPGVRLARAPQRDQSGVRGAGRGPDAGLVRYRKKAVELISTLLGYEPSAILHVLEGGKAASEAAVEREQSGHRQPTHVTAADMCAAVRDLAVTAQGGTRAACDLVRGWGITRSEDVGRIVAGLVEAGVVRPSDSDSPADFHHLFTLEQWLTDE